MRYREELTYLEHFWPQSIREATTCPRVRTLLGWASENGYGIDVWCVHCRLWHHHGRHSPNLRSHSRERCTCPVGTLVMGTGRHTAAGPATIRPIGTPAMSWWKPAGRFPAFAVSPPGTATDAIAQRAITVTSIRANDADGRCEPRRAVGHANLPVVGAVGLSWASWGPGTIGVAQW